MATTNNFAVHQGTDVDLKVVLTDNATPKVALNLSRVHFTVKKNENDPESDAVIVLDSHSATGVARPGEIEITDGVNGKATIKITATKSNVPTRSYHYDIKVKDTAGKFHAPLEGTITIKTMVTDRNVAS